MGYKFNPFTGNFDKVANDDYVNITGDVMTGDLELPVNGFIMTDENTGIRYRCTLTEGGHFTTTEIVTGLLGQPIGLLLSLTYAN